MFTQYHLSPAIIGVVFLALPASYALSSPIWGWIVDRMPLLNKTFIVAGYTLGGAALYFIGPAPFLPIPHMLWLTVVSLCLLGVGVGTLVVTFHIITQAALSVHYTQGLAMYGVVAGVFTSCFSLGAFTGPVLGGYLYSQYAFELSGVVIGSLDFFMALLLLLYILITSIYHKTRRDEEDDDEIFMDDQTLEKQPLLKDGRTIRQHTANHHHPPHNA